MNAVEQPCPLSNFTDTESSGYSQRYQRIVMP